jgi:hypothetical protein
LSYRRPLTGGVRGRHPGEFELRSENAKRRFSSCLNKASSRHRDPEGDKKKWLKLRQEALIFKEAEKRRGPVAIFKLE